MSRPVVLTLKVEIQQARDGVSLSEKGYEELIDRVTDAVNGDLHAAILDGLELPEELRDLIVVCVEPS